MPTSYDITQAISLGNTICDYFVSSMIDSYGNGNKEKADSEAINACFVRSQVEVLEHYQLNGADTELTADELSAVVYKIHEYDYAQLLDIEDFSVQVGSEEDALGTGESVIVLKSGTILPTPRSYQFTVESDGQTVFTMPFDVAQIDTDALSVVLNEVLDPQLDEDFTLSGTTFTWTSPLYLTTGMVFNVKYEA